MVVRKQFESGSLHIYGALTIVKVLQLNKTPAKAFTPPAKTKMTTRPGRAATTAFIKGVVYSLISVLPNEFFFKSVIIRVPSKAF